MKKIIALLATLILSIGCVFGLTACGEDEKTLYVYTHSGFAPFEYVDANGDLVGVDMDVMEEIGEVLGYKIVFKDIEFPEIFNEVQKSENAVGAAGITKRDDRDALMQSSIPYFTSTQYAIAPKGTFENGIVITTSDIISKAGTGKIGVQNSTTGYSLMETACGGTEKLVGYQNSIKGSEDIGSTVALYVVDKLPAESIVKNNQNLDCWEIDAEVESYAYYFNKSQTELIKDVNKVIENMLENGVIDYLVEKHSGLILGD